MSAPKRQRRPGPRPRGRVAAGVLAVRATDEERTAWSRATGDRSLSEWIRESCNAAAYTGGDAALEAIVRLARQIGRHWRDQQGVNGALLDELADATEGARP